MLTSYCLKHTRPFASQFPFVAVRELHALRALRCDYVVNLIEVCTSKCTSGSCLP